MLLVASRKQPVRWEALLHDLLHMTGFTPAPSVISSLNALTTYAASPLDIYSDSVSGTRATKMYSGLLLSLHAATSSWPAELLDGLALPPVRIGDIEIPVSGPAMEVFVVLYNAAVCNCNAGTSTMARLWADQACSGTRSSSMRSAPNSGSKIAYKLFQAAAEIATYAEQALAEEVDKLLSVSDCHLVQKHFDFRTVRELSELCIAVTKYVYSTTFGALSKKHDTLAKLAYQAATMGLPAAFTVGSLSSLPTLLLAAYHRHQAEYYSTTKVPDMSLVLGHIVYAKRLVEDVEQEFINTMMTTSSSSKDTKSQGSGWGLLGRLSAGLMGTRTSKEYDKNTNSSTTQQPFKKLLGLLEESDLVKIFPLAASLIRDILTLYDEYQHENTVAYYTRPAREKDVIADTPEVEPLSSSNVSTTFVPLANKLSADMTKFSELPTAEILLGVLQGQEVEREVRDELKRQLAVVRQLIRDMEEALLLPMSVQSKLSRLEPLLRSNKGSVLTLDERINEIYEAVTLTLQRHETVSNELYRAKCEYIGEYVASFRSTVSLKEQERSWRRRADKLRDILAKELPHHGEVPLRQALLFPEEPPLQACTSKAKNAAAKAKEILDRNAMSTDECADCMAQLKEVRNTAATALRRITPLCIKSRWMRVAGALGEAVSLITEADNLVEAMEAETQLMEKENIRISLTPRENDVECSPTTATRREVTITEDKMTRAVNSAKMAQEPNTDEGKRFQNTFVSTSLLQRIRQRQQEMEEEMNRGTSVNKRR